MKINGDAAQPSSNAAQPSSDAAQPSSDKDQPSSDDDQPSTQIYTGIGNGNLTCLDLRQTQDTIALLISNSTTSHLIESRFSTSEGGDYQLSQILPAADNPLNGRTCTSMAHMTSGTGEFLLACSNTSFTESNAYIFKSPSIAGDPFTLINTFPTLKFIDPSNTERNFNKIIGMTMFRCPNCAASET